jgi:hypothetical protein
MAYVDLFCFRTLLPRAALLRFMAETPPGSYVFVAGMDAALTGLFVGADLPEYFCNEFCPDQLERIPFDEVIALSKRPGVRIWGDASLLEG